MGRYDRIAREQQLKKASETIHQLEVSFKRNSGNVEDVTEDCSSRKTAKRASKPELEDVSICMVESVEQRKASEEKTVLE